MDRIKSDRINARVLVGFKNYSRSDPALTLLAHPDESAALGLVGYLAQAIDHSVRARRSPSYQAHAPPSFDGLGEKHTLPQLRKIASATIFDPNFSRFHTHGAVSPHPVDLFL